MQRELRLEFTKHPANRITLSDPEIDRPTPQQLRNCSDTAELCENCNCQGDRKISRLSAEMEQEINLAANGMTQGTNCGVMNGQNWLLEFVHLTRRRKAWPRIFEPLSLRDMAVGNKPQKLCLWIAMLCDPAAVLLPFFWRWFVWFAR